MMKAAEKISTGLVTFAARDSSIDGQSVKEGQILGMENGKITTVESNVIQAAYRSQNTCSSAELPRSSR